MRARDLAIGALLAAFALLIPLTFTFLRVMIPPFTATLASHVPIMLAMLIGPSVALIAGLASTVGFLLALGPVIAARAFIHVIFGVVGAYLVRSGLTFWAVGLIVLPIHALGEALVVVPFGWNLYRAGVVVGVGTALHHIVDLLITFGVLGLLRAAGMPVVGRKAA